MAKITKTITVSYDPDAVQKTTDKGTVYLGPNQSIPLGDGVFAGVRLFKPAAHATGKTSAVNLTVK